MTIILSILNRFKKFFSLEDSTVRFIAESVSEKIFKIGQYLAMLQATMWLFHALSPSFSSMLAKRTSARDIHILACNFAKYSLILKFFSTQTQQ